MLPSQSVTGSKPVFSVQCARTEAHFACNRLAHGHDLCTICDAVLEAVNEGLKQEQMDELRSWTCHLAMHVLHGLAVVCSHQMTS